RGQLRESNIRQKKSDGAAGKNRPFEFSTHCFTNQEVQGFHTRRRGLTMAEAVKTAAFREPTGVEKLLNRLMGALAGWGLGAKSIYLLQVRGRKSGRFFSTPVYVMDVEARWYLIAPRGRTQWVRNAEAAGEIALKRGSSRRSFRLKEMVGSTKCGLLKTYLERYVDAVQRYFPVKAGSPAEAFEEIAEFYPAYELMEN